ncbi:hypothetical protein POV27_05615 [Aureisphaera galaxeae]|uniref:hypothetical protein n=1 Tax=Aureisphaera galaxeae TaxID=1538023 RepID=UPI0023507C7D|nr:hypothetical protein [Aureisphaera galaxeae]MDC8003518.1 hypothetical protein [Aureisphaera galaxeae]
MSTLVKLIMALVLNIVSHGEIDLTKDTASHGQQIEGTYTVQQLNPHYIITRDEMLSQLN